MRGPKPLPTALRALSARSHHAPNRDEPEGRASSGRCPRWVPKGAPRWVWGRLAPELVEARVLTSADETALGLACCAVADYLDAREVPDRDTLRGIAAAMAEDPDQAHRLVEAIYARARSSTAQLRAATALLAEFGLTPSSRSRIRVSPTREHDPLEAFLSGGRGAA